MSFNFVTCPSTIPLLTGQVKPACTASLSFSIPAAGVQTVALVLDNGPTHASKQLPDFVEELATTSDGNLTIQLYWLPTNASWLDQIEIWFSLLQRKLLQPNHFTSLSELEQAIGSFIDRYNQTAKPLKWSYTIEQLEHKLAPRLRAGVA